MPFLLRYIPSLYDSGDDNNGEDEEEGRARKSWEVKRNVTVGKKSPGRRWKSKNLDDGDRLILIYNNGRRHDHIDAVWKLWVWIDADGWLGGTKALNFAPKMLQLTGSVKSQNQSRGHVVILAIPSSSSTSDDLTWFQYLRRKVLESIAQTWTNMEMDVQGEDLNPG